MWDHKKIRCLFLVLILVCSNLVFAEGEEFNVTGVEFKEDQVFVDVGDVCLVEYDILPENATNKNVSWWIVPLDDQNNLDYDNKSNAETDKSVVDLYNDDQGNVYVKGVSAGDIALEIITDDGYFADILFVDVKEKAVVPVTIPLESLKVLNENNNLRVGDSLSLLFDYSPSNGDMDGITWYSSDPSVIAVSNELGVARALQVTDTPVRVGIRSEKYNLDDYIEINVVDKLPDVYATDIEIPYTGSIKLYKDQTMYITYKVIPEDVTFEGVTCVSLDSSIVEVLDKDKCYIKAKNEGDTDLVITSNDGKVQKQLSVFVEDINSENNNQDNKLNNIYFRNRHEDLKVGEKKTLELFTDPAGYPLYSLVWHSSNRDVVSVNNVGEIEALSEGRAIITVESKEGVKTSVYVDVSKDYKAPESITLKASKNKLGFTGIDTSGVPKLDLELGDVSYLDVDFNPKDVDIRSLDWSTSDDNIVSVNNKGVIKAIGVGEAYIKAKVRGTKVESIIKVVVHYNESYWKEIDKGYARSDKDFIVVFSKNIKNNNSNKEKIFISNDPKGDTKIDEIEILIEGNKVIFSVPKAGWDKSKKYYIFIVKGVKGFYGDEINKSLKYVFQVENTYN